MEQHVIRSDIARVEMAVESAPFDCAGHNFHNLSGMNRIAGTQ